MTKDREQGRENGFETQKDEFIRLRDGWRPLGFQAAWTTYAKALRQERAK